jgi:hypothetical protein
VFAKAVMLKTAPDTDVFVVRPDVSVTGLLSHSRPMGDVDHVESGSSSPGRLLRVRVCSWTC